MDPFRRYGVIVGLRSCKRAGIRPQKRADTLMQVKHHNLVPETMSIGSLTLRRHVYSEVGTSKKKSKKMRRIGFLLSKTNAVNSEGPSKLRRKSFEPRASKIRKIVHHVNSEEEVHASKLREMVHHVNSEEEVHASKLRNKKSEKVHASKLRNKRHSVPHDLMLNILSKVPAKSLVRFRCVRKQWNFLFHDPYFVRLQLEHASKSPSTFLGHSCKVSQNMVNFYSFEIEAGKLVVGDGFRVSVEKADYYRMSNACDGLISFYGGDHAYVMNPSTREWMALPEVNPHRFERSFIQSIWSSIGMGFSTACGAYKLVRIYYAGDGSCRWSCEVLRLGADCSWRSLGKISYPVNTDSEPVHSNGYIYWTVHDADFILGFDVGREEFVTVELPQRHDPEPYGEGAADTCCFVSFLEGSLCVVEWRSYLTRQRSWYVSFMHVHVLKDHSPIWTESHNLKFRSASPRIDGYAGPPSRIFPLVIRNGKVLLFRRWESWMLYDLRSRACLEIGMSETEQYAFMCNRSLPFTTAASIIPIC